MSVVFCASPNSPPPQGPTFEQGPDYNSFAINYGPGPPPATFPLQLPTDPNSLWPPAGPPPRLGCVKVSKAENFETPGYPIPKIFGHGMHNGLDEPLESVRG